jgi:hypothetical protein
VGNQHDRPAFLVKLLEQAEHLLAGAGVACNPRARTTQGLPDGDALGQQVRHSFHPEGSGDVAIAWEPFCFVSSSLTGTTPNFSRRYRSRPGDLRCTRKRLELIHQFLGFRSVGRVIAPMSEYQPSVGSQDKISAELEHVFARFPVMRTPA